LPGLALTPSDIIYNNPNAYYVIEMQNRILSECRKNHFELLIHPCNHQTADLEKELTNLINHSRIAGLVLTPPFSEMPGVSKMLDHMCLPYVRIISGRDGNNTKNSCILVNDHQAALTNTQHLIELEHRDIGFLCGGQEAWSHQPNETIAHQAVKLLIAKIQGRTKEYIEDKNLLQSFSLELVIRDSTGPLK